MIRFSLALALFLCLSVACRRKYSQTDVKVHLEKAMSEQLAITTRSNATHPHFDVLDVVWFTDSTFYLCEFTVKMTMPNGKDTTGIMKRKVSRDFKTVKNFYADE